MISLYTILHYLIMPFVLLRLAWRGFGNPDYWRRWNERFGFCDSVSGGGRVIWIHAVSVGEAQAAVPLVRALMERYPEARVLMTTTTPTGAERVARAFGAEVEHRYIPYDLPGSVGRFLNRVRPALAIIMETELWPNLLDACARRNVPVVLANVRLSERSARGYRRMRGLVAGMLRNVDAIAVQSHDDAERLKELGAPDDRVEVTGSIKFDVKLAASVYEEAQVLRRCWNVDRGVWIAASTHEGEDQQILNAFARVLREMPNCLLVLVPRHPERFAKAATLCRKHGYNTALRSQTPESCVGVDVFIGDTMGELPVFYAASDVAFMGGTLVEVGGHNMLEPAALGVPLIIGPHVFNFTEISLMLCNVGAAIQIVNEKELGNAVIRFLKDANLRHSMGEKGRNFVIENRGALERVMGIVGRFMN